MTARSFPIKRAPAKSLILQATATPEPMDDFDRWLAQYVAAIARLEGITVTHTTQVA